MFSVERVLRGQILSFSDANFLINIDEIREECFQQIKICSLATTLSKISMMMCIL